MARYVTLLTIALSMIVSPALMYVLSIDYATRDGSLVEKIHVATTLSCFVVVLQIVATGRMRFNQMRPHEFFLMLALTIYLSVHALALGRPAANIIVTFLTPILLMYLLLNGSSRMLSDAKKVIGVILAVNSLVGIAEILFGATILPRVAGSVLIYNDERALGLIGHPLTSAFITGLFLIYLVISRLMSRFDGGSVLQIVLHAGALVAFGGRVALVSTVALIAFFVVFDNSVNARKGGVFRTLRRTFIVVAGLGLGAVILFSGLADNTLSRFASDDGSALARYSAIQIVASMPPEAIAFGMSASQRAAVVRQFGTEYGIEITWISWVVDYGVFVAFGLCIVLATVLMICLRNAQRYHWYMAVYFLVCITASQGLGSKSLMLAWFVAILLIFGRQAAVDRPLAESGGSDEAAAITSAYRR